MSDSVLPAWYDEKALQKFIDDWKNARSEDTQAQTFFRELCRVLGVDPPPTGAPDENYRFEKRIAMPNAGSMVKKRADVYKGGHFVWENKSFSRAHTGARHPRWTDWMRAAYNQGYRYGQFVADQVPSGEYPPFLVVCDIGRDIWVWNTFADGRYGAFEDRIEVRIQDLVRPKVAKYLRLVFTDPQELNPYRESGRVTRAVALDLARLAERLERRLGSPSTNQINEQIARFMMGCIFTMFAEDTKLLPDNVFRNDLVSRWQSHPEKFAPEVKRLWELMNNGGVDRYLGKVLQFNGGLFKDCPVIPLDSEELHVLAEAAKRDWKLVEPSIFGTLLEQALSPRERHRLGAHYTPREYIERIVRPTVIEPLRADWTEINAHVQRLSREAKDLEEEGKKAAAENRREEARIELVQFLEKLRHLHVLDPACGTGNFLYVSMDLIKRLEKEVLVALRDLGYADEHLVAVLVQPDQFLGFEIKPWAKEIAELVLWIGYLQWWLRDRGAAFPPEPILREYRNIKRDDAVLAYDRTEPVLDENGKPVVVTRQGKKSAKAKKSDQEPQQILRYINSRPANWPPADFIVSNPPFIGNKRMRELLGDGYAEAIRKVYAPTGKNKVGVPGDVDYVAYWWHKAAMRLREPNTRLRRFGFITTNSIRQSQSGAVLRANLADPSPLMLQFACPDHPWVDPGEELGAAAVRISMTVVRRTDEPGAPEPIFAEDLDSKRDPRAAARRFTKAVKQGWDAESDGALDVRLAIISGKRINSDLTIGADATRAKSLFANADLCFQGMNLVGEGFRLTPKQVWALGIDLSARPSVLRRYIVGHDLKEAPVEHYVIDFYGLDEKQAQDASKELFNHVVREVKPLREKNRRGSRAENWWIFGEPVGRLRNALVGLERYIATVETSKHRFFVMLPVDVVPDHKLYAIASDDYYVLGVLSARPHLEWSLRAGGSLEDRPTWTNTTTFLRFPFPDATEFQRSAIRTLGERLDLLRRDVQKEHPQLSLTELYNVVEALRVRQTQTEPLPPLTTDEEQIRSDGLCDTLLSLHNDLDNAVLDAYGWPSNITTDDLLSRIVELNLHRAGEESAGNIRWLRPNYQQPIWLKRSTGAQLGLGRAVPSAKELTRPERPKWIPGDDRETIRSQVAALRQVLSRAAQPLTVSQIVDGVDRPPRSRISSVVTHQLEALEVVGVAMRGVRDDGEEGWRLA